MVRKCSIPATNPEPGFPLEEPASRARRIRRNSGVVTVDRSALSHSKRERDSELDERLSFVVQLSQNRERRPRHGRSMVIASHRALERMALAETALQQGWTVTQLEPAEEQMLNAAFDPRVVLVVLRPAEPFPQLCESLRSTRYLRDIIYLAASGSKDECEEARSLGATLASPVMDGPELWSLMSLWFFETLGRYPPRLRFFPFELDPDEKRVWVHENGVPVEKTNLTDPLFKILEELIRNEGRPTHVSRLCDVSHTAKEGNAIRQAKTRLCALLGAVGANAIDNSLNHHYGLKRIG